MTALTYIDNNSTFRYVVSTGVDRAGRGELVKYDVIVGGQQDVTVCDRGGGKNCQKMRDVIIE